MNLYLIACGHFFIPIYIQILRYLILSDTDFSIFIITSWQFNILCLYVLIVYEKLRSERNMKQLNNTFLKSIKSKTKSLPGLHHYMYVFIFFINFRVKTLSNTYTYIIIKY